MNCPESHDLLQNRLDGHSPADRAALESHLAGCAECRERHAATLRLTEGLARLTVPVPPAGLRERIVAGILAEHRATVRFRRVWTAAAIAAGLLLAALWGFQAHHAGLFGPGKQKGPEIARDKEKDGKPPVVVHRPTDPSLRQTFEEAGVTALALTRRTAGETVAKVRRWFPEAAIEMPATPFTGTPALAPVLDPPAQSVRQAGETVTSSLKPVTSSFRRAVDVFLEQIPPMNSGS
jgi:hypothetical protein